MTIQCVKRVVCNVDNTEKSFFFLAIRNPDGTYRPGIRHGCNDRFSGGPLPGLPCILCWDRVNREVFGDARANHPPRPHQREGGGHGEE